MNPFRSTRAAGVDKGPTGPRKAVIRHGVLSRSIAIVANLLAESYNDSELPKHFCTLIAVLGTQVLCALRRRSVLPCIVSSSDFQTVDHADCDLRFTVDPLGRHFPENSMYFLLIAASILLVAGTVQFASAGIGSWQGAIHLRRQRIAGLRVMRQAAEIARLNSELKSRQKSALDWRVMEVAEVVEESSDCRSYYLVDPYGQPLPDFCPGQYLMVRPAIAGIYQTTRCYSLSSSPNGDFWRITVKRQEEAAEEESSRGPKGPKGRKRSGGLSRWLHETVQQGDCLLIGGPSGEFYLHRESTRPLILMAAGVGITPMVSMLRWSLENTPERPVTLLYQVKDLEHWPLGEAAHQWSTQFEHVRVVTFCSRSSDQDMDAATETLGGRFFAGKFDSEVARQVCDAELSDFYMCGPDGWMQALREGLIETGIESARLHWESFGGTGAQPTAIASNVESVEVRFEMSDVDASWADPEQTLWEVAREADVEIPSGCLSGVCGCCRVRLLQGEVEYDREIKIDLAEDECLTCVSRPKSAVVLGV